MCSMMCIIVLKDWYMCSRIGICVQDSGMCWEKDWYMCSMMCIIVLKDWYMCSRIGICARSA
jgi:hypothetical protein